MGSKIQACMFSCARHGKFSRKPLFNYRSAFLRRDKDQRIRNGDDIVLLTGARKQVVARTQLDATDAHNSREDYNFLSPMVGVAWKPRSSGQSHDGRTAASFVVSEKATLDAGIVRSSLLSISCFVHQHC